MNTITTTLELAALKPTKAVRFGWGHALGRFGAPVHARCALALVSGPGEYWREEEFVSVCCPDEVPFGARCAHCEEDL